MYDFSWSVDSKGLIKKGIDCKVIHGYIFNNAMSGSLEIRFSSGQGPKTELS